VQSAIGHLEHTPLLSAPFAHTEHCGYFFIPLVDDEAENAEGDGTTRGNTTLRALGHRVPLIRRLVGSDAFAASGVRDDYRSDLG
jgi:hypothetical protein